MEEPEKLTPESALAFASSMEGLTNDGKSLAMALNDQRLSAAIEDAIAARGRIAGEQAKISKRIHDMLALQAVSEGDIVGEIEVDVEYQHYLFDLVANQLNRAADLAEERKAYLAAIVTPAQQDEEKAKCANGVEGLIHWIHYWAWTADPRPDSPLTCVPFGLFDFQVEGIKFLWDHIFDYPRDFQIVKSRDMGWSWLKIAFDTGCWFFAPSSQPFLSTFGSRKEDLVDKSGDIDTLLQKARYLIERVPGWMLPTGFVPKNHLSTHLKITNPATGSLIKGESSNDDFARAGRQTTVTFDEFAAWPGGGYEAHNAASESTRSRGTISTPQGKFNKFADIHFKVGGLRIDELVCHWKLHPWKDDRWYNYQKKRQLPVDLAQEVDLDFEGSIAGRLFPFWDERIHVITQEEFCRFFKLPAFRIPDHWAKGYAQDVGTSEDHPNVTSACAVAPDDSPLPGNVFFFYELCYPVDGHPGVIAPILLDDFKQQRIFINCTHQLISHEGKSEQLMYEQLGLDFEIWDTEQGYTRGYAQMQAYLQPDKKKVHPFRPFLLDDKGKSLGAPMMYLVVANDAGGLVKDDLGRWVAKGVPKVDGSTNTLARARAELPGIHIPKSESGKPARARRHYKKFDDAFDTMRALAAAMFPPIEAKNLQQRLEEKLPESLQSGNLNQFLLQHQASGFHAFQAHLAKALNEVDEEEGITQAPLGFGAQAVRSGNPLQSMVDMFSDYELSNLDPASQPKRFRSSLMSDDDGESDDDEDEN